MEATAGKMAEDQNMSHITVKFLAGIEEKDKKKILEYDKISNYEFLQNIELKTSKKSDLLNIIELPKKISIPHAEIGRLPEKEGEIALDYELRNKYNIDEEIELDEEKELINFKLDKENDKDKEKKDSKEKTKDADNKNLRLKGYKYRVVGFVTSVEYMGKEMKGVSFNRQGDFAGVAYITKGNFNEVKNKYDSDSKDNKHISDIAYLRFSDLDNLKKIDKKYNDKLLAHKQYFEEAFKNRADEKFDEINNNILKKIRESEEKINDGRAELERGRREISTAKIRILEAEEKYR